MTFKSLLTIVFTLFLTTGALAEHKVSKDEKACLKLLNDLPQNTVLEGAEAKKRCLVSYDTLHGYASTLYVKRFKCIYAGSYKYLITDVAGYEYSREGFKYVRYYSCPSWRYYD